MKTLKTIIKEVSLSRIFQHVTADYPSAVLSAFKPNETLENNEKAARKLEAELRKNKFGFNWLLGTYTYDDGTKQDEISMFVAGKGWGEDEFEKTLLDIAKRFDQESILYTPADSSNGWYYYVNGRKEDKGKFHANLVRDWMSRLKGKSNRSFVFEGLTAGDTRNYIERQSFEKLQK